MSEEEEQYEAEEEEEAAEEAEPAAEEAAEEAPEAPKPKPRPPPPREESPKAEMTEAEMAMLAAKRKHEEEEAIKIKEYEEMRAREKSDLEEELTALKEKQARRKQEREEEEQQMAERRKAEDERRKQEEEERKQKSAEAKQRKDAEKMKKLAMMAGNLAGGKGGANFVVTKQDKSSKPPGGAVQQNKELTKEQLEDAKKNFLANLPKLNIDNATIEMLRDKIKQLHTQICKLEADKYDLEKRHERQEYDLKELGERQRQQARQKALKKGLDPEEAANTMLPPKVPVSSKYDRQIDRRSYGDRRTIFNEPKALKEPKVFHGTARPPGDWGRKENEELEQIRKNLEPPKYVEVVKDEAAKPPIAPIPSQMPELDEDDYPVKKPTAVVPEKAPAPAPAPAPEPAAEPEAEEEEEE